jgi:hypothetical protein
MSAAATTSCPSCQRELPPGARFCANCAARVAPRPGHVSAVELPPNVPEPVPVPSDPPGPVIVPEPEPVPHVPPGPVIVPEPQPPDS